MFGRKKRKPNIALDAPLSPEADQFLAEATVEFNTKQEALSRDWRFGKSKEWGYDQESGIFRMHFADGSQFNADGQILGSYCAGDSSWEWAWNNPNIDAPVAKDSHAVKALGERLGIEYLTAGMIPIPGEAFVSYLCAIGIKATESIGVYRGDAGPIDVLITLKRPRIEQSAEASAPAKQRHD